MSITIPFIFFGVAAFLLNVVLGRLVTAQREQIAALKALGFPTTPLVFHYLKLVAVIVLFGSVLGLAAGYVFGEAMIASYHGFFRLPVLVFALTPWSALVGFAISLSAASLGVVTALQNVVALAPAVAMRPAAPRRFHRSWIEGLLSARALTPRRVLTIRNFVGRPLRSAFTIVGIALAVPMVVLGAVLARCHRRDGRSPVQPGRARQRHGHLPPSAQPHGHRRPRAEPGVLVVEGYRIAPVRLRAEHRSYLTSVSACPSTAGCGARTMPHCVRLTCRRMALRSPASWPNGSSRRRRHRDHRRHGGPASQGRPAGQRHRRRDDRDVRPIWRSIRSTDLLAKGL